MALCYGALCLVPIVVMVWSEFFRPGKFDLIGVYLVVLGMPWTLMVAFLASALHTSAAWIFVISIALGCALNGWLLYKWGARLDARSTSSRGEM